MQFAYPVRSIEPVMAIQLSESFAYSCPGESCRTQTPPSVARPQVTPGPPVTQRPSSSDSKSSIRTTRSGGVSVGMSTPGAARSTVRGLKFDQPARLSSRSDAATQMTFGSVDMQG